jgi:hypothetical protein
LQSGSGRITAVFTVTNAVLFKGFRSIEDNHRILYIGTQNNGRGCCVSYPDFLDWRNLTQSFTGLGAIAVNCLAVTIGQQLARAYPQTNEGWIPHPRTFTEFFVSTTATTSSASIWAAVGFVLLIARANLANLMLARAIDRAREMSVRVALGASRWRIIRQLLIESLALSAVGGLAGWWIAKAGVRAYQRVANPPTLTWSDGLLDYAMDGSVLAYVIAVSMGTAILFGLMPALGLA